MGNIESVTIDGVTTYQPWDEKKAADLRAQAADCAAHNGHGDALARENCPGCALRYSDDEAPDYAGWLRIYIELGRPVPRRHYDTEMVYAEKENPPYHTAVLRDVATFGIEFV